MTIPADFLRDLEALIQKYSKHDLALRIEGDPAHGIVKLLADTATPLALSRNGITDVLEHAHTVAEHHPYWGLLENSAEIAAGVLEGWQGSLSGAELDEIRWHIRELDKNLERLHDVAANSRQR